MTTRLAKVSRKTPGPKKLVIQLLCPSCRGVVRAQHVGQAVVLGARKEVVMCLSKDCELTWIPARTATPAAA